MAKTKTTPWDPAEPLETDEDIAAYLEAAFEEGDLEFATIMKVISALGLKLHAAPAGSA